jgi:hypothetical protein
MVHIEQIEIMWKDEDSRTGNCPGLHRVVEGSAGYVVVGKVTDPKLRDQVPDIGDDEVAVYVPSNVLDRLRGQ